MVRSLKSRYRATGDVLSAAGTGFDLPEEGVRALLREQHPDLADLPLKSVVGGWDNRLWRLGEDLSVRLPQMERSPELLEKEQRWLPLLAPELPLPVPVPVRSGTPTAIFPRPWSVARWVPGEPADYVPVSRGDHAADTLAAFFTALHRPAPADAPTASDRGVPLRLLDPFQDQGDELPIDALRPVWADALAAAEWTRAPRWLHADLHPANAVVADGTLAGVIDFGDMCAGDPATDLSAAWLLLPSVAAVDRFFEAYLTADQAMIRRARGWAVLRTVSMLSIGLAGERGLPGGKVTWGVAGRAASERIVADWGRPR